MPICPLVFEGSLVPGTVAKTRQKDFVGTHMGVFTALGKSLGRMREDKDGPEMKWRPFSHLRC